jgi:NAD binding domain of 6-phosphogluconate dehydrogenase
MQVQINPRRSLAMQKIQWIPLFLATMHHPRRVVLFQESWISQLQFRDQYDIDIQASLNRLFEFKFVHQDTPPLDVERVTQTLKEKNIQPSSLKFGFLGLGIMGSGIVKNLLNSGHKVIVWNRTSEKVIVTAIIISL